MELKGLAAIDKADLNCFIFTHAAPESSQKFFCLLRCDERAEGFLLKWLRTAGDIYGGDVLQDHAPTRENILQLLELCNLLLPSDREDKLFITLPETLKPVEGAEPFAALCFRSWHDCIEPGGSIYSLNEEAYSTLTCTFSDCSAPEDITANTPDSAESALGALDQGAVIWENGKAHIVSTADTGCNDKEKEPQPEPASSADNTAKTQAPGIPDTETDTDKPEPEKADAIEEDGQAAEAGIQIPDSEPEIIPTEGMSDIAAAPVQPVSLAAFLPGITPPNEEPDHKASRENGKTADEADGAGDPEPETADAPSVFCGGRPVYLRDANSTELGQEVAVRNPDKAAADFEERRALVDDVLSINSPDLSAEDPETQEISSAKTRSLIDNLIKDLADPKFARNLQIMVEARLKGKFSHIDYVTADGRHCYAAFCGMTRLRKTPIQSRS